MGSASVYLEDGRLYARTSSDASFRLSFSFSCYPRIYRVDYFSWLFRMYAAAPAAWRYCEDFSQVENNSVGVMVQENVNVT